MDRLAEATRILNDVYWKPTREATGEDFEALQDTIEIAMGLREALVGVVAVADRQTDEFDAARYAISESLDGEAARPPEASVCLKMANEELEAALQLSRVREKRLVEALGRIRDKAEFGQRGQFRMIAEIAAHALQSMEKVEDPPQSEEGGHDPR